MKIAQLFRLPLTLAMLASMPLWAARKEAAPFSARAKEPDRVPPVLSVDTSPVTQDVRHITTYADVLEPAQKSVVSVHSSKYARYSDINPILREFFNIPKEEKQKSGLGSGVVVSANGYILTNNHVIDGADELTVQLHDDREFVATVVGADPKTDIAVLKIEAEGLHAATLADSDKLRVGDVVFALGNPLGVGQTVTMGIVSAVGRSNLNLLGNDGSYESFIQTDAAINMGNSGGALVDAKGRLIGINTAILSPSRGNIGIGFSVPINMASSIMQGLIKNHGVIQRGMLGITPAELSSDYAEMVGLKKSQKGVLVEQLKPEGGPADQAGIQPGDIITGINGKSLSSVQELRITIAPLPPGSEVKVSLLRPDPEGSAETLERTVVLGALENDQDEILSGVSAVPLTPELRRKYGIDRRLEGLIIQTVADDSPYRGRLAEGIVILEVNRSRVTTPAEFRAALRKGATNLIAIHYRGRLRHLVLPVR